jgi:hypothetical protein
MDEPRAYIDPQNSPRHGLGEATTFPLIIFFVLGHGDCTQMSFCPRTPKLGIPKFPKLGFLWLWKPITFCTNFQLGWGLKQSYSPHQKLCNGIRNFSIQWILIPKISLWKFGNPLRFQFSKWEPTWECVVSFPHTLLHFREHEMWLSNFTFGPHLCKPLFWLQAQG